MCGIGGVLKITPPGEAHTPIPEEWLDLIDDVIAHRGPDGSGRFRDTVVRPDGSTVEVALVHRRLAIIDIEDGAQPMVIDDCSACAAKLRERADASPSPSGRGLGRGATESSGAGVRPISTGSLSPLLAIVFNGCIYNHRELRAELEANGHIFKTDHSDTEVIGHLYAESGGPSMDELEDDEESIGSLFERIDGMYALAVWDRLNSNLITGRDSHGEKPLYIYEARSELDCIFASVPGPLREIVDSPLNRVDIPEEDAEWPTPDRRRVVRGWLARGWEDFDPSNSRIESWDRGIDVPSVLVPTPRLGGSKRSRARSFESLEDVSVALDRAVASRLEADVPLGCFLSGGVDSSLVAHYASQHVPNLTTLTVRMPDERYDESRYAELVAEHLGTNHITLDCDGQTAADDVVHLITQLGLPFGDSSILPTYWLCREARKHVKVALSGDGADELFYGYDRYRAMRVMPPLLRYAAWLYPTRHLDRADPKSRSDRLARLVTAARHGGYTDLLAIFPTPDRRKLLGRKAGSVCKRRLVGTASMARNHDLHNYLPGDILRKTDTASMSVALEVRAPFLEKNLVEAALATPARRHLARGEGKHLLKELARKHLPREIASRPKQGFAIPISDWLRSDFGGLRTLMMAKLNRPRPFGAAHDVLDFNLDFVRQMIDEHDAAGLAEKRHNIARRRDHGQRLFALMSLAIWAESLEA